MSSPLTHFDDQGQARMVDVGEKAETHPRGTSHGTIRMRPETLALIESGSAKKEMCWCGARIAAIQGAKRTSNSFLSVTRSPSRKSQSNRDRPRTRRYHLRSFGPQLRTHRASEMEALTAVKRSDAVPLIRHVQG